MKGEAIMSIKKHYSIGRKRNIKTCFELIIFFVVIAVSYTFARYTDTTDNNGLVTVAKWNIEVNGEKISQSTNELNESIKLFNVEDNTTSIDSGDECYFDIIINPSTTEVAVSYNILIDLAESNLPDGTKITKYMKYKNIGESEELISEEDINLNTAYVAENILLSEEKNTLDNTSIRRYRFYCKIPFPIDIEKDSEYTVAPKITIEQYIR